MMKKTSLVFASALIALLLPGCFQSETTIHLNKDGSGTLVEETRLGHQTLAMFEQISGMGGDGKSKEDPVAIMFSEDKFKARASKLGEGVTLEKSEPVSVDGCKGVRVTYRFKDINKLKYATNDSMKNLTPEGADAPVNEAAKENPPIVFTYADGQLTIKNPQPDMTVSGEKPAAEAATPDIESPEAKAMISQMFTDMKISLKLVADGGISESNATYTKGDTVTLMDVNFGKLMENADVMKKLAKADPKDISAAMVVLKGIDGVNVEPQQTVTVKLK